MIERIVTNVNRREVLQGAVLTLGSFVFSGSGDKRNNNNPYSTQGIPVTSGQNFENSSREKQPQDVSTNRGEIGFDDRGNIEDRPTWLPEPLTSEDRASVYQRQVVNSRSGLHTTSKPTEAQRTASENDMLPLDIAALLFIAVSVGKILKLDRLFYFLHSKSTGERDILNEITRETFNKLYRGSREEFNDAIELRYEAFSEDARLEIKKYIYMYRVYKNKAEWLTSERDWLKRQYYIDPENYSRVYLEHFGKVRSYLREVDKYFLNNIDEE